MNTSKTKDKYQIAIVPGDGIGKEVMEATIFVLDSLGIDFDYVSEKVDIIKFMKIMWEIYSNKNRYGNILKYNSQVKLIKSFYRTFLLIFFLLTYAYTAPHISYLFQ